MGEHSVYWLPRHRYYELKHFCLQYPEWKRLYSNLDLKLTKFPGGVFSGKFMNRPVENLGILRGELIKHIRLIESLCKEADEKLYPYIFKAVTEGYSYARLRKAYDIPCGEDLFYDRCRKFYWLLSQER